MNKQKTLKILDEALSLEEIKMIAIVGKNLLNEIEKKIRKGGE